MPGGHPLQAVITNSGGRTHGRLYIVSVNDIALGCSKTPNSGETISLQLQVYR